MIGEKNSQRMCDQPSWEYVDLIVQANDKRLETSSGTLERQDRNLVFGPAEVQKQCR